VVSRYLVDATQIAGVIVGILGGFLYANGAFRKYGYRIVNGVGVFIALVISALAPIAALVVGYGVSEWPLFIYFVVLLIFLQRRVLSTEVISEQALRIIGVIAIAFSVASQLLSPVLDLLNIKVV
jgi:hypothetical protein